jgi:hypothetical protein
LVGSGPDRILVAAKASITGQKGWVNPFGDGKTAQKMINILKNELAVLQRT